MVGDISCRSVASEPKKWKACQQKMAVVVTERLREHIASVKSIENTSQLVLLTDDSFQYQKNCGFALLYVNVPAEHCHTRNAIRNEDSQVPDEAFEHMMAMFEPPDGIRNFWEVNTFEVNNKCENRRHRASAGLPS
ncbi:hypothetical protein Plhal304r1_c044g0124701 [Plasmopara halstedii]